jgi:ankyrin repeat protein
VITHAELSESENGHTELMHAALDGDTESVNALLTVGADVNAKDNKGRILWRHPVQVSLQ